MRSIKEAIINIGSENITLAVLDSKYPNSFLYESSRNYSGYQDGEFLDKQELFWAISSLVKECEASIFSKLTTILVGVPGEFTAVIEKIVEMTLGPVRKKITSKDADSILIQGQPEETNDYIAINASPICYILDENEHTINPENKYAQSIKAQISYVLCEKYFYQLLNEIADSLNLVFEYTSILLAEIMYILPHTERDKGAYLVDIGFISASVAYSQGDGIVFSRSFSLGGGYIAADLMEVLEIPFENAYILSAKLNINLEPSSNDQYHISVGNTNYAYGIAEVNAIALARIIDICQYIKKAIDSCSYKTSNFTSVYLTGSGFANIIGAKECMSRIIGRNVEFISSTIPQYNKPNHSAIASLLILQQKKIRVKKNFKNYFKNIIKFSNRRK